MANPPRDFSKDLTVTATGPLSTYIDKQRIRLEAKLEGGGELYLWLTKDQFEVSLRLLRVGARQLGVGWPKPLEI